MGDKNKPKNLKLYLDIDGKNLLTNYYLGDGCYSM